MSDATRADEAVERVRARAIAMLRPGDELAMATDAETFAAGKKPAVLLAIARPTASVVLAIDTSEYTWEEVAFFAGWELKPALRAAHAEAVARRGAAGQSAGR